VSEFVPEPAVAAQTGTDYESGCVEKKIKEPPKTLNAPKFLLIPFGVVGVFGGFPVFTLYEPRNVVARPRAEF
jgi:hypothetical protein